MENKSGLDKHECTKCGSKCQEPTNKSTTILKDKPHYLDNGVAKGGKTELEAWIDKRMQDGKEVSYETIQNKKMSIEHPLYIVYDLESDTPTDTHGPNHIEVDILCENDDHSYQESLKTKLTFEGYDSLDKFISNILFHNS